MLENKNLFFSFCLASIPFFLGLMLPTKHYATVDGHFLATDFHRLNLAYDATATAPICKNVEILVRAYPSAFLYQNSHVLVMTSEIKLSDRCIELIIESLDYEQVVITDEIDRNYPREPIKSNEAESRNEIKSNEAYPRFDDHEYEGPQMRKLSADNQKIEPNKKVQIARNKTPNVIFYGILSIVLLLVFIKDAAFRSTHIHRL